MDQFWHFAVLAYVNYYPKLKNYSNMCQFNSLASHFSYSLRLCNLSGYFIR